MKALFSLQSLKEEQAVDAAMSSHMTKTGAQLQKGRERPKRGGSAGTEEFMEMGMAGACNAITWDVEHNVAANCIIMIQ